MLFRSVTEEIVLMDWPAQVRVTAVDESDSMIEAFWPGDVEGRRRLIRGDWFDFPASAESFDLIVGDGVFNIPAYPDGHRALAKRMASLLKPDGLMIVRVFTQFDQKEDPDDIVAEIRASEHFDYWSMRYRFITSLQRSAETGIYSGTLPTDRELEKRGISVDEFVAKTGHEVIPMPALPPAGMDGLLINFPTRKQFVENLAGFFRVQEEGLGEHPLAARTPVYCMRRVS